VPTPEETADLPDFDLELTASRIRLAYHGEFGLPDGTASPARLVVSPAKPLWLELGPGGRMHLGGTAELSLAGGPSFTADVLAAPPDYRLTVRAKGIRVPDTVSLTSLLPDVPVMPVSRGISLHEDTPADELLLAALRDAELVTCASASLKRLVAGEGEPGSGVAGASVEEEDPVSEKLGLFSFWRCVVMKRGYDHWAGMDQVPHRLMVEIERLLANPPTDFGGLVDRGGGLAFEFHARLVAELGGLAVQVPNHPSSPTGPTMPICCCGRWPMRATVRIGTRPRSSAASRP